MGNRVKIANDGNSSLVFNFLRSLFFIVKYSRDLSQEHNDILRQRLNNSKVSSKDDVFYQ